MRRFLAILVVLAMVLTACGSSSDDAGSSGVAAGDMGDDVTISFGFGFPEGHPVYQDVLAGWGEDVNAATNGTVTVEFFPGGALGPPPTEYERVESGVNDMGWSLPAYTAGRFPLVQVVEMPFLFENAREGTDALWTMWDEFPEFQEEFSDTKMLGFFVHDTGALWSSTGEKTSLADVEGMSLRSAGQSVNRLIEGINGVPVNMPVTELFDSMDRGVVDGTVIASSALVDFNLTPLIDSGILCDCYVLSFFVNMNLDTWNSLSPAQQAAIEGVSGREMSLRAADIFDRQNKVALDAAEAAGIVLYTPEGAELEAWKAASDRAAQQWVDLAESEGLPGQAMWDRMTEITGG